MDIALKIVDNIVDPSPACDGWMLLEYLFHFLIIYGACKKRKYCNRMSGKKKNSFHLINVHVLYDLEHKTSKKNFRLSVWLSVCPSACTRTIAVDTITFEGVSGFKQNLLGVFYVWNVGLVLKSKVTSWSWSWSWTGFWFWQKLCGTIPNLVGIIRTQSITIKNDFDIEILILIVKKKSEKMLWNKTEFHAYET